jgi:hypothetical protein
MHGADFEAEDTAKISMSVGQCLGILRRPSRASE